MKLSKIFSGALFFLLFFSFGSYRAFAQTAAVRGSVYVKKTGESLPFTYVYLQGTTYGATTDGNGYFTITHLPEGNYVLMVASLGYDTIRENITLKKNDVLSKKY